MDFFNFCSHSYNKTLLINQEEQRLDYFLSLAFVLWLCDEL